MARSKPKIETPKSTAQQLASLIKSCRDIMRKDKGLNGDLDRLPMLTWVMFLKFLNDMEEIRQEEATLAGKKFRPAIESPYRWRDWAARLDGITGPELIAFINQDEAVRPDGKRGPGLFAYLRSLESANGDRRDVIARVFEGTVNRMINGYLLRDILNKVNEIHFTSKDEIHTLGHFYETMLREMRDAAGDSGEFYTPRPVIKFIVSVMDPTLGETVLDPAAGTGGFLVEAFEHLKKQCQKAEDYSRLQRGTLYGIEAKSLPYLLCQMNLLLHGLEYPEIDPGNALRFPLREIGDKDRVDIIMTNPPFGGEEERGILSNFPEDKQTAETALLFLQVIMRKLRRPVGGSKGGRCGMVVPNGVLFGDGVCARIKEELLKEFNLHTIVRLPNGVFAPYTSIPTNLLFFDRSGPTKEIWYYEQPIQEGRKNYTKTQPLQFEEFAPCLEWWKKREENERAWKVPAKDVLKYAESSNLVSVNLDIKNPNSKQDLEHLPPEQLVDSILRKEQRIAELMREIKQVLARGEP
ncbi:MAG: SAM-dependent DNA methyltransferase [Acidobacteria bacterium]|nr:SAM-dependent DNA methyltransferase [Acidobacteriota bacterium]